MTQPHEEMLSKIEEYIAKYDPHAEPLLYKIKTQAVRDPEYMALFKEWLVNGGTSLLRGQIAAPFWDADFVHRQKAAGRSRYPFVDAWTALDTAHLNVRLNRGPANPPPETEKEDIPMVEETEFKLVSVNNSGVTRSTTVSGYLAEKIITVRFKEVSENARTVFAAVFERGPTYHWERIKSHYTEGGIRKSKTKKRVFVPTDPDPEDDGDDFEDEVEDDFEGVSKEPPMPKR